MLPTSGAVGATTPPSVRDLQATAVGGPGVRLEWSWPASESVTNAKVRYNAGSRAPRTSSSGDLAGIVTRDRNSLTVYGLVPSSKYSFAVFARGHGATSAAATLTVRTLDAPTITSTSLPPGVIGAAYSAKLTVANGTSGVWAVDSGTLPKGLSLTGARIAGKPTKVGTSSFVLSYDDQHGDPTYAGVSISVAAPTPSPSPSPTPSP